MATGTTSVATRRMAACPVPATGWGSRTRGAPGMPTERATKSPWGQKSSVTSDTEATPRLARFTPSRTVPVVQLPQCPYAVMTALHSAAMPSSRLSGAIEEASPLS